MAKHKVVKAKAKASTVVSNVTKGVKGKDVPKASMPKADILINSIVTAFMYPNRNAGEVNHVRVNLKGKDTNLDGLTKAKLNINDLNIDELIKQLFISLTGHSIDKFMYGYKNAYNFAFGIVPKGLNSYKSVITHHKGDGVKSLIINANKNFGIDKIKGELTKAGLNFEFHKTYYKGFVDKENLPKVIKLCQGLVECQTAG